MQQQIMGVLDAWRGAEQLDIQHVRQPTQWMPIRLVKGRERPAKSFYGEAALHHGVVPDVAGIVETDEVVLKDRRVDRGRHRDEAEDREAEWAHQRTHV